MGESYEERKIRPAHKARGSDGRRGGASENTDGLGWTIGSWQCDYKVGLPELSGEEKEVVRAVAEAFREESGARHLEGKEEIAREISRLLAAYCAENGIEASKQQFEYLARTILAHVYGFSALEQLLGDDALEEIAVVGIGKPVFVYHRQNGWMKTNCAFTSGEAFVDVVNKMARELGRRITLQVPRMNAVLPDKSRMHASIPPISNYELTIRKFRGNPIHVADLLAYRTYSAEALAFLWLAMQSDSSIIVAGNTASGKTSTLNALFQFVPLRERVLVSEETPEINIPHENQVKLLASSELGIAMKDLVADSLRMRPDRVIVGEARSADEVGALLETIISGQARGSYATFHAQSGREALVRMHSLGALPIDLESIDLIVVQRRMMKYDTRARKGKEVRRCTEICEVVRIDENKNEAAMPALSAIFKYDMKRDAVVPTGNRSRIAEGIQESFDMTAREFAAECDRRAKFLRSLDVTRPFAEITQQVQKFAYADYEEPEPRPKPASAGFFNTVLE